jgi:hypothetical protein
MINRFSTVVLAMSVLSLAACSSSSDSDNASDGTTGGTTDGTTDGTTGGTTDGTTGGTTDGTTGGTTDGTTGGTTGGNVSLWGTVSVDQDSGGSVDLSGAFIRGNLDLPSADIIEAYQPELDTCEFTADVLDATDPLDELPDLGIDFSVEFVSAGEVITFNSPAGTFAELQRETTPAQSIGGVSLPAFTVYSIPESTELTGQVPANLSFDIPGDVFPAFANVSVPAVAPLEVQSPAGTDAVTASTTFTWTAGSNPDAYIEISVSALDFATLAFSSLDCTATDDGSFTIPAAVQTQMGSEFSATGATLSRTALSVEQEGGALLFVDNMSSVTTGFGF